jgi:hypothetical protein
MRAGATLEVKRKENSMAYAILILKEKIEKLDKLIEIKAINKEIANKQLVELEKAIEVLSAYARF